MCMHPRTFLVNALECMVHFCSVCACACDSMWYVQVCILVACICICARHTLHIAFNDEENVRGNKELRKSVSSLNIQACL